MPHYDYRLLDVFTSRPFKGNPLAVFLDGTGIDGGTMQRIAAELNLSETVFVLPAESAGAGAKLRIFTPRHELNFAGHPTIGTAHALLASGMVSGERFALEEGVGDVAVRVEEGDPPRLWLTTPAITLGERVDVAVCARALGLEPADVSPVMAPQFASAGNPFLYIALVSTDAVDRAVYSHETLPTDVRRDDAGTFLFTLEDRSVDGFPAVYARMLAPQFGILEDPATGSAAGPLAAVIAHNRLWPAERGRRFVIEQGTKMGRRSLLHVATGTGGTIEVGGTAVEIGHGTIVL